MPWYEVVIQYGGEEVILQEAENIEEAQQAALMRVRTALPGSVLDIEIADSWQRLD